uniref:T9SS type A sorting domain-containing protein n=1 Tax=candidate division WOR-3 bacterium TaxID=2052148 RepID=A0A7C3Z3P0_UNCW3
MKRHIIISLLSIIVLTFISFGLPNLSLREDQTGLASRFAFRTQKTAPTSFQKEEWRKRLAEWKEMMRKGERGEKFRRIREKRMRNRMLGKTPGMPVNPAFSSAESLNCRLLGKLEYFPGEYIEVISTVLTDSPYTYVGGMSELGLIPILKTNIPSEIEMKGYLITDAYWLPSFDKVGDILYAVGEGEEGGILLVCDVSNPENPRVLTSLSIPTLTLYDVVVQGNYAYIGDSRGFRVVDITTRPPTTVGYIDYGNDCWNLTVSGSYAYVIEEWRDFVVIDISNPSNPWEVARLPLFDIWDCAVSRNYAFVCGEEGLFVIDISDPTSPSVVTQLTDVWGMTMEIEGDYAYLGGGEDVFIVSISEPEDPKLVCHFEGGEILEEGDGLSVENRMIYLPYDENKVLVYDAHDFGPPVIGSCGDWYGIGVDIQDNFAYAVSSWPGEFHAINISTPQNPTEIWSLGLDYPQDVVVSGNYGYVADYSSGLRIIDLINQNICGGYDTPGEAQGVFLSFPHAYIADGNGGLRKIDVSNPNAPFEVGSYDGINARKVFVADGYVYVAGYGGLVILNVSDLQLVGQFSNWSLVDVYVVNDKAYVVGYDENWKSAFGIINVSDPGNPTLLGSLREGGGAIFVQGDYAYLASSGGLKIIDITNPSSPSRIGIASVSSRDVRVALPYGYTVGDGFKVIDLTDQTGGVFLAGEYSFEEGNEIEDVYVSGMNAYVASDSGLQCLRIIPRNSPRSIGKYYIRSGAHALDFRNNYAYVLSWDSLFIIDVSAPSSPVRKSTYYGNFRDVKVDVKGTQTYAYLVQGYPENGLRILDVTNPNAPNPRGFWDAGTYWLYQIAVSGDYSYITAYDYNTGEEGFFIINIGNPDAPQYVGFVRITEGYPTGLAVLGTRLYVAFGYMGLYIYDITNPGSPGFLGHLQEAGYWYRDVSVTPGGIPIKEYAFVTSNQGLRVIDVTNSSSPSLFGYYKPAYGEYSSIFALGAYAYVGGDWGFSIIEASLPGYVPWQKMGDITGQPSNKKVKGGGGITAMGEDVYLILGNNTLDFMKYNISNNSWSPAGSVPGGDRNKKVKKGAYIVDDENEVYLFKGGGTNEFYKYDPSLNSWSRLNEPGFIKGMKGGFACYVRYNGNFIYAGSGANNNEWKRFNIGTGNWEGAIPPTLPVEKAKVGSGLTYDGTSKIYFLWSGGKKNYFYYCDLSQETPEWRNLESLPLSKPGGRKKKVKEGGAIDWFEGKVYAVKGGNTKEFWVYFPEGDSWHYIGEVGDATTKGIKCGRSLTASDFAGGIFCLIGNNTNEFWFYTPSDLRAKSLGPATIGNLASERIGLRIMPNPTKGLTKVYYNLPTKEEATLRLYNSVGSLVYSAKGDNGFFTIKKLPAGIYLLRFEAKGFKEERKLVVVK